MKEEVIKRVLDLIESRNKIMSEFRVYFGINLSYCSISEVKKGNSQNEIIIVTDDPLNPNKEHTFSVSGHSVIRETGKTIFIDDSSVVIDWVKDKMIEFNNINKKLEEL